MRQKKNLYIILVAVCIVVLVGLIVLAIGLDASRRGSGNHSTDGQTQSTGDIEDSTGGDTKPEGSKPDETTEGTEGTDGTTESTGDGQENTKPSEPGGNTGNSGSQGSAGETTPTQGGTQGTTQNPTQGNETQPSQPDESQGGDGPKDKWSVTYEEYNAMSGKEQEAFYYSFDSADDYFEWYKAAKQAYEDSKNDIVIGGDGSIDLGEILNGKN